MSQEEMRVKDSPLSDAQTDGAEIAGLSLSAAP
jgi:hypothetical protein